ncbi:MAG: NAD(P)H-dependent oxidoreductase [Propylenella sp.]
MAKRIVIIQGHPDRAPERYCRALASAYERGARAAGHEVRRIDVATLDFDLLRSAEDWQSGTPASAILMAQDDIAWAEHVVILYPLWLGAMPALLKGFLEQVLRPGFAVPDLRSGRGWPKGLLAGRTARIVVTMGMPAFFYRWYFGAHSLKSLERNILKFVGIKPIRETLIGMVAEKESGGREKWLKTMEALGKAGR